MDESFNNGFNNQNNEPQQNDYTNQYAQNNQQQTDYSNQYAQYNAPQNNYNEQYNQYSQPVDNNANQYGYNQPQQYNSPYYNQQYPQYTEQPENGKGFAIASLVIGILSLTCCCGSFIPSILGLVFGIVSKKRQPENNGMAVAGIVLSIIGIVFSIIYLIFLFALGGMEAIFYSSY